MKTWLIITIVGMGMLTSACATSTFMIGKSGSEKRGVFLGTKALQEMLCGSGEMEKILAATHLSKEMKDTFYQYNCSAERSSDKVKQLYASMTTEQRRDIRTAFKKYGYAINGGAC